MQREEKQLEMLLDAAISRLNELKVSIGTMIHRVETESESIYWPTFLDNFALISGQVRYVFTRFFVGVLIESCFFFSAPASPRGIS